MIGRSRPRAIVAVLAVAMLAALARPSVAAGPAPRKAKLTAYFATGFEDPAWQKEAYARVLKGWKPTSLPAAGKKTVVITVIARNGEIVGARDNMLSGDAAWDKAAFEAVRAASPMPALPKTWPHATLEVHWHFEVGS